MNGVNNLLMALLECEVSDLNLIADVCYDFGTLLEEMRLKNIDISLYNIIEQIFRKGAEELCEAVDNAIKITKEEINEFEKDSKEHQELVDKLEELEQLNPTYDLEWFSSDFETSIHIAHNEEIYRKYLHIAIEQVQFNMGFLF